MKVGIDIDEIITEFAKGYLKLFNKKYNKNVEFEDLFTYSLWKPLGISRKDSLELAEEYYSSDSFDNIKLVQGAEEGVKKLKENHELVFITSRPAPVREKTEISLRRFFPELNLEIIYSSNSYAETNGKTKGDICNELEIDLMIEDDLEHALDCAEKGIKVILLDKPWNQRVSHENLFRIKNWDEILDKINELNKIEVKNDQ